jgi:hypothetical protein
MFMKCDNNALQTLARLPAARTAVDGEATAPLVSIDDRSVAASALFKAPAARFSH